MANNQQVADFVSPKVLAAYDQALLERVVEDTIWDKYGIAKQIKAHSNSKKGFVHRYKNILPTTTPLAEYNGTVKAPVKIVREEVEYQVGHYGDYIEYSDELDLYDFRMITDDFLNILGDHAAISMETVRRDAIRGGSNVVYAGTEVSRLAVAKAGTAITKENIKTTILKLKGQGAKKLRGVIKGTSAVGTKPVRSAYIGVCSIYATEILRGLDGWQDVEDYANFGERISEREVGRIADVRFVESDNDEGLNLVGNAATLATSTVLYDVKSTEGITAVDAGNETVIIEQTMIMGKDSYVTTTVRGKQGIQTIIKPIGSAGTNDPLNQVGTIGWKSILGATIVNQNWIVRLEHVAPDAIATDKHYYNNA